MIKISDEAKKAWKTSQVMYLAIEIIILVLILIIETDYSWLITFVYGGFMLLHQVVLISSGFKNETELIKEDENQ